MFSIVQFLFPWYFTQSTSARHQRQVKTTAPKSYLVRPSAATLGPDTQLFVPSCLHSPQSGLPSWPIFRWGLTVKRRWPSSCSVAAQIPGLFCVHDWHAQKWQYGWEQDLNHKGQFHKVTSRASTKSQGELILSQMDGFWINWNHLDTYRHESFPEITWTCWSVESKIPKEHEFIWVCTKPLVHESVTGVVSSAVWLETFARFQDHIEDFTWSYESWSITFTYIRTCDTYSFSKDIECKDIILFVQRWQHLFQLSCLSSDPEVKLTFHSCISCSRRRRGPLIKHQQSDKTGWNSMLGTRYPNPH